MAHERRIGVIGLGYVGLAIAIAFGKSGMLCRRRRGPKSRLDKPQSRLPETRARPEGLSTVYPRRRPTTSVKARITERYTSFSRPLVAGRRA
jgi:hypothetical protein